MILDSHCHAWESWPYSPAVPDPNSRGMVEQLLWEMDRNEVEKAVLVCANIEGNPENNEYTARAVASHPDRLLQFADLDCRWSPEYHIPGAADRLRRLLDRMSFTGITHYVRDENDRWFVSDEGMALFAAAAERDLIVSLAVTPDWQDDLCAVARAFPTLPILCHHLAGARLVAPGRIEEGLSRIVASAEGCPNILVKVSGFYYGSDRPWDYPLADARWIVRALYEAFGARRLCWGSDYPVLRRHITYRQSLEMFRTHFADFVPPEDRSWVLGRTLDAVLRTRRPLPPQSSA